MIIIGEGIMKKGIVFAYRNRIGATIGVGMQCVWIPITKLTMQ
jgi:hypothetical protein